MATRTWGTLVPPMQPQQWSVLYWLQIAFAARYRADRGGAARIASTYETISGGATARTGPSSAWTASALCPG